MLDRAQLQKSEPSTTVSRRRYDRERRAREEAEQLLEQKSRELFEANLQLEEALTSQKALNKLQSEFVAMASHEFRTPLTIIDGAARRIKRKADGSKVDLINEKCDIIQSAVQRMSNLVEQTLNSSEISEKGLQPKPAPFNFGKLVEEVILRQKQVMKGHVVTSDLGALDIEIEGDLKLLDHVITNLVSNAFKYSQRNPVIEASGWTSDDAVHLRLKDYGIGIPANELKKLGEHFFRASNTTGITGTGLGLNLVFQIVKAHGGNLDLSSEEGQWTEAVLTLPRVFESAASSAPAIRYRGGGTLLANQSLQHLHKLS